MSTFTSTMFDSIKQALNKQPKSGGIGDILKTTPGNIYEVRLLPCVTNPDKTFFHYFSHGWTSFATGQYVNALSPQTWGERDPISEMRYQHYRSGSPEEKDKSRSILRSEKWLVNVYVVNDPSSPENNGTVKVLRFGKQLHSIIMDAIEGDDSDQFGPRIFDLSKNGCSFRIKVDKQGDFPSYVSSRFLMPAEIPGISKERAESIYDSVHDLEEVLPRKNQQELTDMLNEHYLCVDSPVQTTPSPAPSPSSTPVTTGAAADPALEEDVPWGESETSTSGSDDIDDDTIKNLLDGLDND